MAAEPSKPRAYLPHLLGVKARTAFGRRITPPFVTLYVTTRCDEKCIHCFYWDQLNTKPNQDFTLDEFRQSFDSMGEIYNLFLGGGEPFLRPDLAEIILAAQTTNRVANVYTPTNGQHTERVVEVLEKVLPAAPSLRFHLNLSVDHIDPEEYDRIRGRAGAWRRMLRTAEALAPLRRHYPNLIVHTLTTVMRENQDRMLEIHEGLKQIFQPDGASYNYCRGYPLDPKQAEVDPELYRALRRRLEDDYASGRLSARGPSAYSSANHLLDQRVRETVERTVVEQRPQFSCVSGRLACVIYSNGDVVECETNNSPLGNLRKVGYDFRKLWFSAEAEAVAHSAANGCFCTHECGHYASNIYSLSAVGKIAWKAAGRR
ncbi:MAG: radical SAM protein [Acidobacteria bacterium]|nr:radical SAM protein [Acidobacteriota bacterium]